ncbi:hypothetical protein [Pantoea latae]|uniref:hypothetical protein n=1 Tax=Pantoea latae TaxID=1964541 RepID=UPI00117CFBD7|nr:hypothetical protein [Pantoea latae]
MAGNKVKEQLDHGGGRSMILKKVGLPLWAFLVLYWIIAIFLILFLLSLSIAFIFFLKNGNGFYFDFLKESSYSLSKAVPGGSILGSGLWVKAWLQQRKEKREPSE